MKHIKIALHIIYQFALRFARLAFILATLIELYRNGITDVALFNLLMTTLITLEIKPITITQHIQAHDVTISGNTIANQYGTPCKCRCAHGDQPCQPGRGKEKTN